MEIYKNISTNSGVVAYKINDTSILVQFKNADQYLYNYDIPGKSLVDQMKELAENGKGLASFISKNVKSNFAEKWQNKCCS